MIRITTDKTVQIVEKILKRIMVSGKTDDISEVDAVKECATNEHFDN